MYYDRGDMPITVNFNGADRKIGWKLEPEHIDYHLYLPIFFEGLRETREPYKFLADRVFLIFFIFNGRFFKFTYFKNAYN